MASINAGKITKGMVMLWKNEPYLVIDFQRVNPGKGSAFTRTKLKNSVTGNVYDATFKTDEKIEEIELEKKNATFLYGDKNSYNFLDSASYEQSAIDKNIVGEQGQYLKENLDVQILFYQDRAISVILPKKIEYKVIEAPEGIKGDSVNAPRKFVTLENNLKISAPLFVKEGDVIRVNTESGEYVERVEQ